jgi:fatty acid desaturase
MKFFQGFLALLAIAGGMLFAAFNVVMHELLHIAMLAGGTLLLGLDLFAFAVWFVNWRYYPEGK